MGVVKIALVTEPNFSAYSRVVHLGTNLTGRLYSKTAVTNTVARPVHQPTVTNTVARPVHLPAENTLRLGDKVLQDVKFLPGSLAELGGVDRLHARRNPT
ncbi:hypothetical protein Bbelb_155310 [Branchiostoma belcheri]|nr:hypothetical protein Bbelb_155310 [Branchiostoma belcheri]